MRTDSLAFVPKIYFPQSIYLSEKYTEIIKLVTFKKPLIIISSNFQKSGKSGFANSQQISRKLGASGVVYRHSGEPKMRDIDKFEKIHAREKFDLIIAIGGGSVLDLSKVLKNNWKSKLVAIPTTIGSSSEVSRFSLISQAGKKTIFHSEEFLPDIVIFNYELFMGIDKHTLALQGIDALAHGLESLVSRLANPISDSFALSSIDGIYSALVNLQKEGKSKEVLEKLKIFSTMAGFAQSSVGTGLIHALAHYFGVKNTIPHASAVATFLIDGLAVNLKKSTLYKKLDGVKILSSKNLLYRLTKLFNDIAVKQEKIKVDGDLEETANQIRSDITMLTNPFTPTVDDISNIIKKHL